MKIKKAVITAAGREQRALPLQSLISSDGEERSVLGLLLEQVFAAGIEETCVIIHPGDESRYLQAAGTHANSIRFLTQPEPRGYGHAIHCARAFTGDDPFLHLVGDHLFVNSTGENCVRRLLHTAEAEASTVSAAQITRESLLPRYGAVGGRRVPGKPGLYRIDTVIEKPTPTEAEQRLMTPGMRAGYYLCFFGLHVLTPTVMEILAAKLESNTTRVTLSDALAELARREQYLALEESSQRYDIGARYGLLMAQMALALNGRDRSEVLAQVLELLAAREMAATRG
ncbi:MAG: UTP--glucose-1-phosphate uridylyltransferase [Bryobacterales bacterium]|nr:UTP--glucose-1-phosphate uridylyltransferase [Bryobacterales bacterium]